MQRWEYCIITEWLTLTKKFLFKTEATRDIQTVILATGEAFASADIGEAYNALGVDGWELVTVSSILGEDATMFRHVFKRKVQYVIGRNSRPN